MEQQIRIRCAFDRVRPLSTLHKEDTIRTSTEARRPSGGGVLGASVAWAAALAIVATASGCRDGEASADERAVIEVVERCLDAAGQFDLESLPHFFAPNANIGATSPRNGQWVTSTSTFDEWHASIAVRTNPRPYIEPVSEFTVHVDGGLAFVRADATLLRDGQAQSHNIDYFTLIRHDGAWKILNGSYVARPIGSP